MPSGTGFEGWQGPASCHRPSDGVDWCCWTPWKAKSNQRRTIKRTLKNVNFIKTEEALLPWFSNQTFQEKNSWIVCFQLPKRIKAFSTQNFCVKPYVHPRNSDKHWPSEKMRRDPKGGWNSCCSSIKETSDSRTQKKESFKKRGRRREVGVLIKTLENPGFDRSRWSALSGWDVHLDLLKLWVSITRQR